MIVFITGASGFIGSNLAKRILTTEPDTKLAAGSRPQVLNCKRKMNKI